VTWRKTAEICSQYLQKGSKVYVEGRLQTRSWDTPEGEKRYMTEVVAETVQFLDRAGGQGGLGEEREREPAPAYNGGGNYDRAPAPTTAPEDIPFD
jgi:single-strand DNA-binding protein